MALQDVGQAVLESYSRILESLAHTVMSRIEDVIRADLLTQDSPESNPTKDDSQPKSVHAGDDSVCTNAQTLSDLLTWTTDQNDFDDLTPRESNDPKQLTKLNMIINKISYLEGLGGSRSPTARH